ncbi:L-fuculokinase [Bacteroidota bacterium]
MSGKIVIVLDCGATNVRSVAINEKGEILAQKSLHNNTRPDIHHAEGLIWDIDEIWTKLVKATKEVISKIDKKEIIGLTITTFGVDGAPMSKSGKLLYPVISWACQRTTPIMKSIEKYISHEKLYQISGINLFSFNTINKLIWFKENKPDILDKMDHFVFMPSILIHRLCGEFVTDTTMAGTSMITDIKTRNFSDKILNAIDVENKFPKITEPGTIVGKIHNIAANETGLPENLPIVATGHDTQFAIIGSGAKTNQAVLSSGTWEILMARTESISLSRQTKHLGITNELDATPGLYNPALQWLGSGILEWIKQMFYTKQLNELKPDEVYDFIINAAKNAKTTNLNFDLDFLNNQGSISGLGLNTKPEEIYRTALEALSAKTKESLVLLEKSGDFKAESLIVVGGGSKNSLWNELRSKTLGIPVKLTKQKETTVLGAALFTFYGVNYFDSLNLSFDDYNALSLQKK